MMGGMTDRVDIAFDDQCDNRIHVSSFSAINRSYTSHSC